MPYLVFFCALPFHPAAAAAAAGCLQEAVMLAVLRRQLSRDALLGLPQCLQSAAVCLQEAVLLPGRAGSAAPPAGSALLQPGAGAAGGNGGAGALLGV